MKIAIVVGSTRPGRIGESVAKWVLEKVKDRKDADFELLDIALQKLPMFDEPIPPSAGKYQHQHTKDWASKVAGFDGFVFVTAEYNHSIPAALKNAIDFVYGEWNNKAAGFVSYGSAGGARAVEHLRQVLAEVQVATVRSQVMLVLADDFENYSVLKPRPRAEKALQMMVDQLVAWSGALKTLRENKTVNP